MLHRLREKRCTGHHLPFHNPERNHKSPAGTTPNVHDKNGELFDAPGRRVPWPPLTSLGFPPPPHWQPGVEPPALQDNVVAVIFVKAVLDGTAAPFSTPCFISKAMVVLLWDMFCGSRGALVQYGIYGLYRFLATLSLGKYIGYSLHLKAGTRRLRVAVDRPVRKPGGINQRLRENYKRRDKHPELANQPAMVTSRQLELGLLGLVWRANEVS